MAEPADLTLALMDISMTKVPMVYTIENLSFEF